LTRRLGDDGSAGRQRVRSVQAGTRGGCGVGAEGRPISTNDVWIAAHAMETGADLVSTDGHTETRVMPTGLSPFESSRGKHTEDRKGYGSSSNILFNGQNALPPSPTSLLIRPSVSTFVVGLR